MSELPYHRIAEKFYNRPLLLLPSAAQTISAFLLSRVAAGRGGNGGGDTAGQSHQLFPVSKSEGGAIEAHAPRASRFFGEWATEDGTGRPLPYRRTAEGVAVITIVGELVNRGAWIGANSGLVSYEAIKFQVARAAADPKTRAIMLDIETPGGEAVGAFEAAAAIRAAAALKPVVAVVNGMAASAGYALASGASRIVTMPTGISGSVGVVTMHLDFSKFLEEEGIKPTLIFAGAKKVDGNPFEALPDSVRVEMQAWVESFYSQFVAAVAAGRPGLSEQAIRDTEADVFKGEEAVAAGLADAVGTFEDVLAELSRGSSGRFPSMPPKGNKMDTPQSAPAAVEPGKKIETAAELSAAYPGLVSGIEQAAATAERERILGIEAIAAGAPAELVDKLKADGKTSPAEAALAFRQADLAARGKHLKSIQDVEAATGNLKSAPTERGANDPQPGEHGATEVEWRTAYAKDAKLQAEFVAVDDFVAFKKNESNVRFLRPRSAA